MSAEDRRPMTLPGCLLVILLAVVILGCSLGGRYAWERMSCNQLGATAEVPTQYRVFGGCFAKVDGRWVPADRWRTVQ